MLIDCIAIDDEPLALEQMEEFIEKVPFLRLAGLFNNGLKALDFLKEKHVDLMFLDIQMDDLTGIQLLETIKRKPKVILTTAYDQYALKGYELEVADYLLKPISFDRFLKAVNKVFDELTQKAPENAHLATAMHQVADFMFVRADYKMMKVNFADILYIEGLKDYLKIVLPQRNIITHMSFKKIEELLPREQFFRIHKSYIVPISKVTSIGKNSLEVSETQIPVGEYYKKEFFDFLGEKGLI
ncbi:MAG: LytR/AlgR family response regulator transcription factor [Bacteroidales bacterium]